MRKEKTLLLDEVRSSIKPEVGFILTGYERLTANEFAQFREQIAATGGDFFALKKRIFLKAASELNLKYELSELEGHVGLVVSNKSFIATTKVLFEFKKSNTEKFKILGGHFDGRKCSPTDFEEVSNLPSLNEMRARFLGTLEAPMTQTLGVLQALLTSVVYCLENKAKKES